MSSKRDSGPPLPDDPELRTVAMAMEEAGISSEDAIERLDASDAEALGLDPATPAYRTVDELEGAGDKAVRDAGSIPVAEV